MLKIDNSLLVEIGLGDLPETEKNSFLKHIYETLEMRVGIRLADQMTNEQLDEFERYFEAKDDAGAFKWLETNFPNYKEIVQQEFDKLKAEVAQSAPQILSASQQGQAALGSSDQTAADQIGENNSEPAQQPQPVAQQPDPTPTPAYSAPTRAATARATASATVSTSAVRFQPARGTRAPDSTRTSYWVIAGTRFHAAGCRTGSSSAAITRLSIAGTFI